MGTPPGLHMSIMEELSRRITRKKKVEAELKGEMWDDEEVYTCEVWSEVHKYVAQEVGCEGWNGYAAIKYPDAQDSRA